MDETTTKTEQKTEPEQPPQVQASEVKADTQQILAWIQTIPVPIVPIKPGPHALPQQHASPRKHNRRQQTYYPAYMGPQTIWTSPPYGEQQKNYKSYFGLN